MKHPIYTVFGALLILLLVPPVFMGLRAWGMESARWKESDYAPSDDDDDDDD